MAGQVANLESAVEQLEDAVAIVNARGELLFANPAMRALLPEAAPGASLDAMVPADHPLRRLSEQTLVSRQSRGPLHGAVRRQRRAAGDDARDQRSEGRSGRRHADRAQRRVSERGAVDGPLLAQAGGARPAVGRRRARGEEPAERDDDPSRAAAAAGGAGQATRRGPCRRARGEAVALRAADGSRRGDPARRRHRARDPPARRSRAGVPEVRAARGSEAAAAVAAVAARRDRADRAARGRARPGPAVGGLRRRARRQRRSGDAAPGVPQPGAERLPGDAQRRHAAHPLRVGASAAASASASPTPASASPRPTCSGSSICISRPRRRAAGSACRWSTGPCRCTTAKSKYSRRQAPARHSACCCRRRRR